MLTASFSHHQRSFFLWQVETYSEIQSQVLWRERDRERDRKRDRERETERQRERQRDREREMETEGQDLNVTEYQSLLFNRRTPNFSVPM